MCVHVLVCVQMKLDSWKIENKYNEFQKSAQTIGLKNSFIMEKKMSKQGAENDVLLLLPVHSSVHVC